MTMDMNLAPCASAARRALAVAWIVILLAAAGSLALAVATGAARARTAEIQLAARDYGGQVGGRAGSAVAPLLERMAKVDFGEGHGLEILLLQLERRLPRNVRVRRLQYNLAEGNVQLDLDADSSLALGEAVTVLERQYGTVRVLERQGERNAGGERISLRLLFRDGAWQ